MNTTTVVRRHGQTQIKVQSQCTNLVFPRRHDNPRIRQQMLTQRYDCASGKRGTIGLDEPETLRHVHCFVGPVQSHRSTHDCIPVSNGVIIVGQSFFFGVCTRRCVHIMLQPRFQVNPQKILSFVFDRHATRRICLVKTIVQASNQIVDWRVVSLSNSRRHSSTRTISSPWSSLYSALEDGSSIRQRGHEFLCRNHSKQHI